MGIGFSRLFLFQAPAALGTKREAGFQSMTALVTKMIPDQRGRGRRGRGLLSQGVLEGLGHLGAGLAHAGNKAAHLGPVFRELVRPEENERQDQKYEDFRNFNAHRCFLLSGFQIVSAMRAEGKVSSQLFLALGTSLFLGVGSRRGRLLTLF